MASTSREDRYTLEQGRLYLSGIEALVRLPLVQRARDRRAGLNTAGFISGYRGSPLGRYDTALWQAHSLLAASDIHFRPAINEDLAATAIWGTQQLDALPDPTVDGVFALWYGKGPGVDRSGDALKHGNMSGTHRHGGVLVVCGDDHPGKSSTVAHQSEQALAAQSIPVLYPANVQEILEYGLLGWAMSRFSGLWVGLKTVNETAEQSATVEVRAGGIEVVVPAGCAIPPQGIHHVPGRYDPQLDDLLVTRHRLPLAGEFVRANRIDRATFRADQPRFGIVAAGKAYGDVLQALAILGIDERRGQQLGLSLYKVGCIWPLEPRGIQAFADRHEELLVVEEKRPFLEDQLARILYAMPRRPRIVGKLDEQMRPLLPADVMLDPADVALAIAGRLEALGIDDADLQQRSVDLRRRLAPPASDDRPAEARIPYFCSGCPHNISTKLPEGSFAGSGIGCHGMAFYIVPQTRVVTQMGGEGATWIGLSAFARSGHVFQNLGDGTYFHSGLLAIRAAIAARINITYKILYNSVVAMTGGQPVDGPLSVSAIARQLLAEGVSRCVVISDDPGADRTSGRLPDGVRVFPRDQLDRVQRMLREIPGCTALIYDQACAVQKRRARKRADDSGPPVRAFINAAVCEGCGDCSVQSNCISIRPQDTFLGRKRSIEQSSCNMDLSCTRGYCPSFVTVIGARPRRPAARSPDPRWLDQLPVPRQADAGADGYAVMLCGIGGTGVMTVASILGQAAHLEGQYCSTYDMTGLAQKNGAVFSHLRIAGSRAALRTARIGRGEADLVLAFDLVAALAPEPRRTLSSDKTRFIGDSRVTPTAAFQRSADAVPDGARLMARIAAIVGEDRARFVDASGLAKTLLGDTIAANLFMVGVALQDGLLPIAAASIESAIEAGGVSPELNLAAFRYGRLWAGRPELLAGHGIEATAGMNAPANEDVGSVVRSRVELLTRYQDRAYAERYEQLIAATRQAEAPFGDGRLTLTVSRSLARLMAYKDEYEVARLYADPAFLRSLRTEFEGDIRLRFNLAPAWWPWTDPATGRPGKRQFGGWMMGVFRLLARLRVLRGTPFDIFGWSRERRVERQLLADYEIMIRRLLAGLDRHNYECAVQIAALAEDIRGFGYIKATNAAQVQARQAELLKRFNGQGPAVDAREPVAASQ